MNYKVYFQYSVRGSVQIEAGDEEQAEQMYLDGNYDKTKLYEDTPDFEIEVVIECGSCGRRINKNDTDVLVCDYMNRCNRCL